MVAWSDPSCRRISHGAAEMPQWDRTCCVSTETSLWILSIHMESQVWWHVSVFGTGKTEGFPALLAQLL